MVIKNKKLKRPRKPTEPIEPYKTRTSTITRYPIDSYVVTMREVMEVAKDVGCSIEDVRIVKESDYYNGYELAINCNVEHENPHYARDLKRYEKSLVAYEEKLAVYKKELAAYNKSMRKSREEVVAEEIKAARKKLDDLLKEEKKLK